MSEKYPLINPYRAVGRYGPESLFHLCDLPVEHSEHTAATAMAGA